MAIVLGTFTYSRWKVCHIAYCYSTMLNRGDLFHWLPRSRMPKMCTIPQLVSNPFNPRRNKKVRVQPYSFIFLLSSFFLLGSFYFSFTFPLLVWFLSLSGAEKPCLLAPAFSLKNAMAAKCAIYGSFVKDRRDILRHSQDSLISWGRTGSFLEN